MADKRVTIILAGSAAGAVRAFEEAAIASEASAGRMARGFESGTSRVGGAFSKLGQTMASFGIPFGHAIEDIGTKLDAAESKASKFAGVMAAAGKVAVGVGIGAFAIVGAESVKMATSWDKSMTLLVTAGGESQKNLKMVSDGALKVAADTGTALAQTSEGMYTVEKAGFRGADGLKVLKMGLEGAKAEGVDAATMLNALTSVMMSYHEPASMATQVTNEMVAAAGSAKTNMRDFAASLSTVMPVASAAGISFAQVGGAIATLTQHGTSADEATQELANTIRNLQAPNQVAANEMAQLGLSANDLALNLGKRGLTGTVDIVTEAITKKMGPSGLVMLNAFKENKAAAADMQVMLGKMPPAVKKLADEYLNGTITMNGYRQGVKALPADQAAMAQQFQALANKMNGFNDLLKSGSPAAQTFTDALKKVMGGATGMNTALMLGGANMSTFKDRVQAITDAGNANGDAVSTWAQTQATFAVQLDKVRMTLEALAVKLGEMLIPMIQSAAHETMVIVGWFQKHAEVAKILAGVIGGTLALAIAMWVGKLVWGVGVSVVNFAKLIASGAAWVVKSTAQFAAWIAEQTASVAESVALWAMYAAEWIAAQSAAMATWVAEQAAQMASWVATTVAQLAKSTAAGVVWLASHAAMAAGFIASNIAMAASATAAFIAENAATLGLVAAIAALVAAIIYMATHWKQVWGDIKAWALDAWHFIDDILHNKFVQIALAFVAPWLVVAMHWKQVWNDIGSALKYVYDTFIKPILDMINGAISTIAGGISKVAGVAGGIAHVGGSILSHIPHLADGGVVDRPTLALIGEGNEREFVIPESKLGSVGRGASSLPRGSAGGAPVTLHYSPTVHLNGSGVGKPVTDQDVQRMLRDHTNDLVAALGMTG